MLKLFCLSLLVGGLSAAHNVVKKSGNVGAAGAPPYPLWHLEPLYVKKLPAKSEEKREAASPVSRSEMEESHSVFTDINGERNSLQQQIQKVTKNGKLLSQVYEKEKENSKAGLKPRFQKLTKIDIPDLDIHQQYFDNDEIEAARANHVKRNAGGPVGLRMPSAEELAEYILSTGDQASVVDLIEGVVDNGKMSEEQALVYVETIKAMLDTAEKEEDEIRELLQRKAEEAEREEALRNLLRRDPQGRQEPLYRQLRAGW